MRAAFEIDSILRNRYSGFFTYGTGLLSGFAELPDKPELAFFCSRKVASHRWWLGDLPDRLGATWHVSPFKMRHLEGWWNAAGFPTLQRFTGDFDLYHGPHHLAPPTRGRPRILTVHDLRRQRFPEFYPHSKTGAFEAAIKKADHFIAISQATKDDLQSFFGIADDRIDVVYHGGPVPWQKTAAAPPADRNWPDGLREKGGEFQQFFVALSSYDRRKNIRRTIEAFTRAAADLDREWGLVIIGEQMFHATEYRALVKGNEKRVVFTGYVEDVTPWYQHAAGLVYVSLYEGFGLPILEAMAAGTPVITSNYSSMPEVAGQASLLVDPTDTDAIGAAMVKLAEDACLREQMTRSGHERVKHFSWKKAARETLDVYQKIVAG